MRSDMERFDEVRIITTVRSDVFIVRLLSALDDANNGARASTPSNFPFFNILLIFKYLNSR